MKEQILELLKQSGAKTVSGTFMANRLGISRAAVWKNIELLRKDGYQIDAVTNKGYLLVNAAEMIDPEKIESLLKTDVLARTLEYVREVDSTNNLAKERAKEGAPDGTLILADRQFAGKGRQGRGFYSPQRGGIYMSMILRPKMNVEKTPIITILAASAVCETLNVMFDLNAKIKWVNDIYVGRKKICGILTEAGYEVESAKLEYAVLGIGINLFFADFPEEINHVATCLQHHTARPIDINEIVAQVWNRFEAYYNKEDYSSALRYYRGASMVLGNTVQFEKNGETRDAVAEDIDADGSLIVRYRDGSSDTLRSGEVRIRLPESII